MPTPNKQYMTLHGGEDNDTYSSGRISVGDIIKISNSTSNNGIFTVSNIVVGEETISSAGKDIHYVLRGRGITNETSTDKAVTISIQQDIGDKLIAIGNSSEKVSNQLEDRDVTFNGGLNNWTNAAGGNAWATADAVTSGATEGTFFTDPYLKLECEGSGRRYITLDGEKFEDDGGLSGESMVEGRVYRLSASVEIPSSDYTNGHLALGLSDDSYNIDSDASILLTSSTVAKIISFDFVYAGTSTHAKIIIDAANGSEFVAYIDNVSLVPVDSQSGSIDIWSLNKTTSSSSTNNGWNTDAISPSLSGNNNKYIFHFADEAIRISNINDLNPSYIKWYGYIQRNQFALKEGLSFNEYQQHPNTLNPPVNKAGLAFSYLTSSHTPTVLANYHKVNTNIVRGVKYQLADSVNKLRLDAPSNISSTQNFLFFENTNNVDVNDQLGAGDVVSVGANDLTVAPSEVMLVDRASHNFGGVKVSRGYGGTTASTINDETTPVVVRGVGFNIAVTEDSNSGLWPENNWEFYETFIYDNAQESLPVQISDGASSLAGGYLTGVGNFKFKFSIYADIAYSGRISGGRIYIREKNSREPLTLFADIDIVSGVRMSMLDNYTQWSFNTSNCDGFYVTDLFSEGPNIDTYSSLNGFSPEEQYISIGEQGENYKTSIVTNRRAYIANLKVRDKNNELIKHGDRIMYSEINKFDTFLESNYIDVSVGDFGEYICLKSFADRLVAFKHSVIHIINIGNPNPSSWFLEESIDNLGISHSFNVCQTKFGIIWVNESGCYIYDGSKVSNLIDKKINVFNPNFTIAWNDFTTGTAGVKDAIIGFDNLSSSVVILRSPNNSTDSSNLSFVYDFNSGGWSFNDEISIDSSFYSNFITDYNNNLVVAREDGDYVNFDKYLPVSSTKSSHELITGDIDFGEAGISKKIYAIRLTYKSTATDSSNVFSYATDGKKNWETIIGTLPETFEIRNRANGITANTVDGDSLTAFATDRVFNVDDGSVFQVGDIIRITSQIMLITHISGNTLTVERGYGNTSISTALNTNPIYKLNWKTLKFKLPSVTSCQSVQFKMESSASTIIHINDMDIEWRAIRGKTVPNG